MAVTTCPVLYPDLEDMKDLARYVGTMETFYPNIGICKLIPPVGWYRRNYDTAKMVLPSIPPIRQVVDGRGGAYHVTSLEVKARTLPEFYDYAMANLAEEDLIVDRVRQFWRMLGKGEAPLYGADLEGSLFDPATATSDFGLQEWNLNTGLSDLLRLLPYQVPGVNTTMIYVGMWRAMFAFHVEDLDLYSINYLHTGAAKSWYSIAPSNRRRFEAISGSHYAAELRECREYMRHKTKLFLPTLLKDCGMEYETVVQQPGEFVVTFPGAYHAGFNHGFNVAEATNFATPRWLLGPARKAKRCVCRPHSVYINLDELETLYRRKLVAEGDEDDRDEHWDRKHFPAGHGGSRSSNTQHQPASGGGSSPLPGVVDLTQDDDEGDEDGPEWMQESPQEKPEDLPRMRCECGCLGLVSQESLADLYLRNLATNARARVAARRAGGSCSSATVCDEDIEPHLDYATDDHWSEDRSRHQWGEITSPTAPDLPVARCIKCHFYVHIACVAKYPEAHTVCHLCRRIDNYSTPATGSAGSLVGKRKVQAMLPPEYDAEEQPTLTFSLKKRKIKPRTEDVSAKATAKVQEGCESEEQTRRDGQAEDVGEDGDGRRHRHHHRRHHHRHHSSSDSRHTEEEGPHKHRRHRHHHGRHRHHRTPSADADESVGTSSLTATQPSDVGSVWYPETGASDINDAAVTDRCSERRQRVSSGAGVKEEKTVAKRVKDPIKGKRSVAPATSGDWAGQEGPESPAAPKALKVRDLVVVTAEGLMRDVAGTLTGIEGDLGRLHVKGQRKCDDTWIPLQDCRLLIES